MRLESDSLVSIIKNILYARNKFQGIPEKMLFRIEKEKNLAIFHQSQDKKWSPITLFKNGSSVLGRKQTKSEGITQNNALYVDVSDFQLTISQKAYECIFIGAKLLYTSGEYGFRFD